MNILCRIFGHKPPQYAWRKGWGGAEYCKLSSPPYEDGTGRLHVRIMGECARCETQYQVGMTHLPATAPQPENDMRDASEVMAEMRARATFLRDRGDDFLNVEAEKMDNWANRLAAAEPADAGRADALIRAIAADSTWRTNDNTLWPRITEYIRTARPPRSQG